jgi:tRNA pseudouridine55 synthase
MEREALDLSSMLEDQVLLIDKPLDWTSFDIVNRIRISLCRKCGIKKLKVGHAGTLDPKATGLLIICIGKATKRITEYQDQPKVYTGHIFLGATRPSFDVETEIDKYFQTDHITNEMIVDVTKSFFGVQAQLPPIFSAIKQDGKPVYKKAHKGEYVKMESRQIEVFSMSTDSSDFPSISFEVKCSKGTYIRTIANDFGQKLASGAYLQSLRRTQIGDFSVENAWQIDDFIDEIKRSPQPLIKV